MTKLLFREKVGGSSRSDTTWKTEELQRSEDVFFCRFCGGVITAVTDIIAVNDLHNHTFFNPAGIIYELRCFKTARGCCETGSPTADFSWFAGYMWSLAHCRRCDTHMGWKFTAPADSFFGLISGHLVQ